MNKIIVSILFYFSLLFNFCAEATEEKKSVRLSAIPALGFDSDTGLGGGVVGNIYVDEKGYDPYKISLGFKAYITSKLVNSHALKFEQLKAFDLPLRLSARLGFYSTIAQNYCGKGSSANCDLSQAETAADKFSNSEERKEFIRKYYLNRYMSMYGDLFSRWLLWQNEAKLELMLGYHGSYYLNRDFTEDGPYKNSLFYKDFNKSKINGYLSTLQMGLMLDKRDNEAAPTSGYWLEGSVRGGASFIGSAWDYFGANLAARFYWPLDEHRRLVIASQSILDNILGDLPYDAMSRVGGSAFINDFNAIGGGLIGRGIREQMFVGRLKAIQQLEFRYNFWDFAIGTQNFALTSALFGDLGLTAWDLKNLSRDLQSLHSGFGAGLRVNWNKTFVIRADLAVSPVENFGPRFYLTVGNIY